LPERTGFQHKTITRFVFCMVIPFLFMLPVKADDTKIKLGPTGPCKLVRNNALNTQTSTDGFDNWHMCEFTPPANPAVPLKKHEGTLLLQSVIDSSHIDILKDDFSISNIPTVSRFPRVALDFIQNGTDIIPLQRGTIASEHLYWDVIFEPGKIWKDQTDPESSRVALPFSLQEKNANCIHNGVLTFALKANDSVESLHYLINGETCAYFQFDMWGTLQGHYQAKTFPIAGDVLNKHFDEVAVRLPVKNFRELKQTYPEIDIRNLLSQNSEHVSVFGIVLNGVNYRSDCNTRSGSYPFCDVLDLPSFSTAKSMFAALSMMRLEKLYPGTMQVTVGELINECQANDSWKDVTLSHLLNMASGHYGSKLHDIDENSKAMRQFFLSQSHTEKIQLACTLYPRRSIPGKNWVYHTSDTYLAGTLMNQLLRNKFPSLPTQQKDIYQDIMVKQIWQPLKLSPVLNTTRRTSDSFQQPFSGWGLTYHLDDILRLSIFLGVQANLANGQSLFAENALRAALQRDPQNRGLKAINSKLRYKNGFWAYNIADAIQCNEALWVPFMSGFGGITVVLFPKGTIYYVYSDNHEFSWLNVAKEVNKIMPMCTTSE